MSYYTRLVAARTWLTIDQLLATVTLLATLAVNNAANGLSLRNPVTLLLSSKIPLNEIVIGVGAMAVWTVAAKMLGLHREPGHSTVSDALRLAIATGLSGLTLYGCLLAGRWAPHAATSAFWFGAFAFASMMLARAIVTALTGRAWARVGNSQSVIIVGTGPRALRMYRDLRTRHFRSHRLLGFVDNKLKEECPPEMGSLLLGSLADLEDLLLRHVVDEVYIGLSPRSRYSDLRRVIAVCNRAGVAYHYPIDLFPEGKFASQARGNALAGSTVSITPAIHDSRLFIKRCIDIFGSGAALFLLAPLMVLIAIAVRLTSPGPAIFVQERYGLGRRPFKMYKFRSMVSDAEARMQELEGLNEASGPIFKMQRDPRVTRLGYFLRRSSLDELPQLMNVLLGDMALVGPRPMSVRDVTLFSETWLIRRFSVKPGITCLWQVNGRSNTSFLRWMELDMHYIDNWSLTLDTKILAATLPAIVRGSGAM